MTDTEDWQLEAAEAVIEQLEVLLQQQVQTARDRGERDQADALRQSLFVATRERRLLARSSVSQIREVAFRYSALIATSADGAGRVPFIRP